MKLVFTRELPMVFYANRTCLSSCRRFVVPIALITACLWANPGSPASATPMRWDIISLDFTTAPVTISAGGNATAHADDGPSDPEQVGIAKGGAKLTLTGSGFFDTDGIGPTTGGGTWETFSAPDENGEVVSSGSGEYTVTDLLYWTPAPGQINPGLNDTIGNIGDTRAGLALFAVDFDDGSAGNVYISCRLRGGEILTPDGVFEGQIANKDFITYSLFEAPIAGVDANRTLFHVIPEPSTMTLALCLLPVIGLVRRMRRN